jgi:hypothetical protein
MLRAVALVGLIGVAAGCTATPLVTKDRMTMAEATAGMENLQCRRVLQTGTSIPKQMCAEEATWKRYDASHQEDSDRFLDQARDGNDNRMLYPR